ncbi:MAG: hypothetical protein CM15mP101_10060 [Flavobacteriaceae bacterium]|jgi:hypothetical protein|nr:MAG: hypothetical protein CM15mP101_10060 [Flavobacteriaceae bacterium]|tara:strand:- start:3018 stop:4295 length:1278 start_codon:yes stop_codon:yes gene_type:complete
MKIFKLNLLLLASMFLFVACSDDDDSTGDVVDPDQYVLSGVYTSDISLDANHIWTIRGRVYVSSGATMTIPAGTILKAEGGTGTNASFLCVAQGGKLIANGTASAPIIMTSVADDIQPGQLVGSNLTLQQGLWGGLIVLGNAPISVSGGATAQIEGIPASDTNGLYGGSDASDNSGTYNYISVRHGGTSIGEGNEINGVTFGGVGTGTTVSNIEVVANVDDGIEFFGGTVNASNLLVWAQGDDGLDIDQSYSGTVSNSMVILGANSDHALEIDGPEGTMEDTYTLNNITLVGADGVVGDYADFRSYAMGANNNIYAFNFPAGNDFELDYRRDVQAHFLSGELSFSNIQVVVPSGDSLTGGQIFNDTTREGGSETGAPTPNADFNDGKNPGGSSFASSVAAGSQTVGADASVFSWTLAAARGATGL